MDLPKFTFEVSGRQFVLRTGEFLLPIIVLLFSAYYYVDTRGLPEQAVLYAHPLLYITVLFALIVIVNYVISYRDENEILERKRREHTESAAEAVEEAQGDDFETKGENRENNQYFNRYTATGLVISSILYYQLIQFLGFIVPSVAFCGVTLFMFGERNPLYLASYSIVFSLIVYAVFIRWLRIPISPFITPI